MSRCLTLKGTFEGGMRFFSDQLLCQQINRENLIQIKRWLNHQHWDGILVGNLEMIGPELLEPLAEYGQPVLHHVGFVTPPYPPNLQPKQFNYLPLAASKCVRRSLSQAGFHIQPIPVVYPGARVELFGQTVRKVTRPPSPRNQSSSPLKICFAGIIMTTKGVQTLVESLLFLNKQGVKFQANFAGKPYQRGLQESLASMLAGAGLDGVTQFFGELNREQLSRFLRMHHIFVFPSIYPEAFGIVAAEAMASGLALVSSGVGGAAELFEDGVSGLRFEPGNAVDLARQLQRLAQEPGLLEQLQQAGAARVREQFSVTRSAQQLEALFQHHGKGAAAATKAPNRGSVSF